MTWRDNLRAASSEDGFIIAGGSGTSLIPQNTNWHDNYMNSFTEDGIKIANLKSAVNKVSTLPATGDTSVLYFLDSDENPGMYYYDGEEWATVGGGGGGVTPEQLDARVKQMAGAPTTSTQGVVGQLIEDTTNGKLYQCTAITSSAGVDTEAGLTSKVNNITFTISNATTLNSKLSGFTLTTGVNYAVAKGVNNSLIVANFDTSTNLGTLAGVNAANLANGLGVTPNPAAAWMTAFSQAPNGMPFFTFKMAAGLLTYTWTEIGAGPAVVQTTGNSTTSVISQKGITDILFDNSGRRLALGADSSTTNDYATAIGSNATAGNQSFAGGYDSAANTMFSIAIGSGSYATMPQSVSVGYYAHTSHTGATAIGAVSTASGNASLALGNYSTALSAGAVSFPYCEDGGAQGVVNFGPVNTSYGYNDTNYRLLTGVHDAQGTHDAVTLGQLSSLVTLINTLLNTNIVINNGVISDGNNANNNQDPGSNEEPNPDEPSPDDPSTPDDPSAPDDPGGEPGPEEEPGPEDAEAPMEG